MKAFAIFFRNFLSCTFRNKLAYLLHFGVPIATFLLMYLLLSLAESASFAGTQAIGLVVYFSLIQASLIVSLILKDKEQGVLRRIMVSPNAQTVYVLGNGAAAFAILTVQVLVFVSFITFIFPVPIGMGFFRLASILLIFNLTGVGLAFLFCSLSDTSSGAMMIANLVVMITSLLGGSYFPVAMMSPFLQKLAYAFPQFWVMRAIRQAQARAPFTDTGLSLLILLLFAALFIMVQGAVNRGKRERA
jgi:ABC-2 type transport system permease protein